MNKVQTLYVLSEEAKALKSELKEITQLRQVLRAKQRQIEEAERYISVSSPKLGSTPVQGGETISPQERFVIHLERLYAQYNSAMDKLFSLEDKFSDSIQTLSATEQAILIDRYLNGKSWKVISVQYHYEACQPFRIANNALNKLAKKDDSK